MKRDFTIDESLRSELLKLRVEGKLDITAAYLNVPDEVLERMINTRLVDIQYMRIAFVRNSVIANNEMIKLRMQNELSAQNDAPPLKKRNH